MVADLIIVAVTMTFAVVPGCHGEQDTTLHYNGNRPHLFLAGVERHQHIQPAGVLVAPSDNAVPGCR